MGAVSSVPRSSSSLLRAHTTGSFSRLILESEAALGNYQMGIVFTLLQSYIISMRLITPLSYLGLIALAFYDFNLGRIPYAMILLFCCSEALFFPYQLWKFNQVNAFVELEHFAESWEDRLSFFHKCFDAMMCAASGTIPYKMAGRGNVYLKRAVEEWFFGTPLSAIKRDNYAEWNAWAFFHQGLDTLEPWQRKENDILVDMFEEKLGVKLEPGKNPDAICARLNLDPVFATQRPFTIYAAIYVVNQLSHFGLWLLGYRKIIDCSTGTLNMYQRTAKLSGKSRHQPSLLQKASITSPPERTRKVKLPVVFLHGIGIGLPAYMPLIASLPADVDVFLLECPHIAMQMSTAVPSIHETKEVIRCALQKYGHSQACFVAHSLGTTIVSWLLRDPKYAPLVGSTVLLDPVTFLLCDPSVATNFVYRQPTNAVDLAMHYFCARELYISQAISRYFSWSHNILFAEDLLPVQNAVNHTSTNTHGRKKLLQHEDGVRHTIILSSFDSLVPVGPVSRYLEIKKQQFQTDGTDCFELYMFHGFHGEMMCYPTWIKILANRIRKRCVLLEEEVNDEM